MCLDDAMRIARIRFQYQRHLCASKRSDGYINDGLAVNYYYYFYSLYRWFSAINVKAQPTNDIW